MYPHSKIPHLLRPSFSGFQDPPLLMAAPKPLRFVQKKHPIPHQLVDDPAFIPAVHGGQLCEVV